MATRRVLSLLGMVWCALLVACGGAGLAGSYLGDRPDPRIDPPESEDMPPAPVSPEAWGRGLRAPGAPFQIRTEPGELPEMHLAGGAKTKLPLEHTHVRARLSGFVGEVEVSQTFVNASDEPIEVVYVFPLPENSAVDRMKMVIGARTLEAVIQKRDEARATYQSAVAEGFTAALLEEERPNVFTQSVGNIAPRSKIDVVVHYVQDLTYDAGEYEFVFPMVVGPRYVNDHVADASRISPPYMGKGERSGHDFSIEVVADAALAVGDFEVPTHEVVARRPADGTLRLTLAEKSSLPNRDFVLRYRAVGNQPRAALFTAATDRGKFFSLVVHPPALDLREAVGQREIVFVVDVSGSMHGTPLGLCKIAMREALRHLQPADTFNVLTFSGSTGKAFPVPRAADRASIQEALAYVDGMSAGGGTEALDAVATALSPDVATGRNRYVFFMTDGLVGDDDRIIARSEGFVEAMRQKGQRARVFAFGVGSSPNRSLLSGLSRAGRGIAIYASTREDPVAAVNKFFRWVDRSVVRELRVDWGDLEPSEVEPATLPDLFASHPIVIHGRFRGAGRAPIVVHGKVGDRDVEIPVSARLTASPDAPRDVLALLWARARVTSLEEDQEAKSSEDGPQAAEITKLGLGFGLVTRYTSFVAVDRLQQVGHGDPKTIVQPVERPEGIDLDKAGGTEVRLTGPLAGAPAVRDARNRLDMQVVSGQLYAVQQIRSRRGCGCHAVGSSEDREVTWLALATAAALVTARARRRRRPGRGEDFIERS